MGMAIGHWQDSVTDLVPGYRQTRRMLEVVKERADEADKQTIGGMISDCDYALEWLHHGRRPGARRGIERRAAYQRERPVDPIVLQAYVAGRSAGGAVQASSISDEDRRRIDNVLEQLTPRERDCYRMALGEGMPYSEIAEMLGIAKGTVQYNVERAAEKIRKLTMQGDLFGFQL